MSHYRDAEIAAFIRTNGVTRCPTACVVPTQGLPDPADQAAARTVRNCPQRIVADKDRHSPATFYPLAVPLLGRE
jgi:hypothetical protein